MAGCAREEGYKLPAVGLAIPQADLKGLTADQVNTALRDVFVGNGPLLFLSSTKPVEGGEAMLASVFNRAEAATVQRVAPPTLVAWPYTSFGAPGQVAETRRIEALDATLIRFS